MESSDPFMDRPRMVSVSSRLRRVEASSGIMSFFSNTRTREICCNAFFCVSLRYRISAPAAWAATDREASSPRAVMECTWKWESSVSFALALW